MDEETKIEEEQAEKLTSELGREILRTYALRDSMQYFQGKSAGSLFRSSDFTQFCGRSVFS